MAYRATWGTRMGNRTPRDAPTLPQGRAAEGGRAGKMGVEGSSWAVMQVVSDSGPISPTPSGDSGSSGPSGPVGTQWAVADRREDVDIRLEGGTTAIVTAAMSRQFQDPTVTNLDLSGSLPHTGEMTTGRRRGNNKRRNANRRQKRTQMLDKDCIGELNGESLD
jgi:hypothetical protein